MTTDLQKELIEEVRYFRDCNQPEKAILICDKILEYSPDNPSALFELGDIYREKERHREAIAYLERASAMQEDRYIIHLARTMLPSCYTSLAEQEKKPAYNQTARELRNSANEKLVRLLGDAIDFRTKKEKQIAERENPYAGVVEDFEMYSWYCEILIGSYITGEEYEKAKSYCLTLLEKVPNNSFYNCVLGDICVDLGEYKEAIVAYERALFFETDEKIKSDIWNGLAYIYINTGKREEALRYVKKAIESDPDNINYMDSLAEIYTKMDEYDKALACYRKIVSIDATFNNVKEMIEKIENRNEAQAV